MEPIEIRQNKKTLIPMLSLLAAVLFAMSYYIFFSGKFDNNYTIKMLYVLMTPALMYSIYIPTKKFFNNEAVITFSKSEIKINEKGKAISFLWLQVIGWKIDKEKDGGTYYLTIETAATKNKINISWLDKKPNEIEQLFQTFKSNKENVLQSN